MPGRLHADRGPRRLGGRRRRRQGLPGRRRRPGLPQGAPRPAAPGPADADRRRRPEHRRGLPEGRRLLPGRRRRSSSPRPSPRATSPGSATSPPSTRRSSRECAARGSEMIRAIRLAFGTLRSAGRPDPRRGHRARSGGLALGLSARGAGARGDRRRSEPGDVAARDRLRAIGLGAGGNAGRPFRRATPRRAGRHLRRPLPGRRARAAIGRDVRSPSGELRGCWPGWFCYFSGRWWPCKGWGIGAGLGGVRGGGDIAVLAAARGWDGPICAVPRGPGPR